MRELLGIAGPGQKDVQQGIEITSANAYQIRVTTYLTEDTRVVLFSLFGRNRNG
jgi:hypothetical protein